MPLAAAKIDDADVDRVLGLRQRWLAHDSSEGAGAWGVYVVASDRKTRLHRFLADCPRDMVVDHVNGDTLDNRRANLRIITRAQNNLNMRKKDTNTSGITGVWLEQRTGRWVAEITKGGQKLQLGSFDSKWEAAIAYRAAAKALGFSERHGL